MLDGVNHDLCLIDASRGDFILEAVLFVEKTFLDPQALIQWLILLSENLFRKLHDLCKKLRLTKLHLDTVSQVCQDGVR